MPGPGVQVLHTSPQTLPSQGLVGSGSGSPSQTGMDIEQRPSALQYSITAGQMVPVQVLQVSPQALPSQGLVGSGASSQDRKSTRLNSSHVRISYAVSCLK